MVVLALLALMVVVGDPRERPAEGTPDGAWTLVDSTAGDAVHSLALSGSAVLGGTYYNGLFRIDGAGLWATPPIRANVMSTNGRRREAQGWRRLPQRSWE